MRARLERDYFKVLQEKANQAHAYAIKVAEQSLHNDRPAERRTRLTKGKRHYVDSFTVVSTLKAGRVRVELQNRSPVARMIERGTKRHKIPLKAKTNRSRPKWLVFPVPTAGGRSVGTLPGRFSVTGPVFTKRRQVNHPGGRSFQIMGRTADAIRRGQVARGTGIPSGR